jgi:hypothetical protein
MIQLYNILKQDEGRLKRLEGFEFLGEGVETRVVGIIGELEKQNLIHDNSLNVYEVMLDFPVGWENLRRVGLSVMKGSMSNELARDIEDEHINSITLRSNLYTIESYERNSKSVFKINLRKQTAFLSGHDQKSNPEMVGEKLLCHIIGHKYGKVSHRNQ